MKPDLDIPALQERIRRAMEEHREEIEGWLAEKFYETITIEPCSSSASS